MQNVEHWPFGVRLSRTQNAGTEESEESEKHLPPPCCIIIIIILLPGRERERESAGTGILFEEPNPTGSRPRGLIGLYRKWQRAKSRDPNQLGSIGNGKQERERGANTSKVRRARRRWCHGGSKWGEVKHREEGGGDRGSTAARPTLTRNWGKKIKPEPETGGDLRSETQCR